MFLSKESRQSTRIIGHVLNFPLYDGDCSPAARELLAAGDIDGAIAEWRRLADLGSGRARCVLAYLALKGTHSAVPDLEEARRLATSALSGERGYANYVLGCIALKEQQTSSVAQYLGESYRAGFVPAATLLASLSLGGPNTSAKTKSSAESLLSKAAAAGHRPAQIFLCGYYLRGRFGFAKRILGLVLVPAALIRFAVSAKYHCFSMGCFQYSNRSTAPIFAAASQLVSSKGASRRPRYLNVLRSTHILAAVLSAEVLVVHSSVGSRFDGAMTGWILLAVFPYGLSYLAAAKMDAGSLVATAVQTLLLLLLTSLACSAYLGQLFDLPLGTWTIIILAIAQSALLLIACGLAATAAQNVEEAPEPAAAYRKPIAMANTLLGIVAAGSVFARPEFRHLEYLSPHGFEISSDILLALLPYVAVALFSWRLVTTNRVRPWVYLCVVVMGTSMAVINNCGLAAIQPGYLGVGFMVMAQFIGFGLAAEWALDGNEW